MANNSELKDEVFGTNVIAYRLLKDSIYTLLPAEVAVADPSV